MTKKYIVIMQQLITLLQKSSIYWEEKRDCFRANQQVSFFEKSHFFITLNQVNNYLLIIKNFIKFIKKFENLIFCSNVISL